MEESKKSICYMNLAEAFITRLRKEAEVRTKSRMLKGVGVQVLPVTMDKHDFIYDYLMNLYKKKKGTFNKSKIFSKQTIYECERSNPCRGSSTGDPTKTRANGCNAYVSFMFEEGATITACVIRFRLTHNGHDPNNRDESRVSRIDASLKFIIEMHINNGVKISEIMNEIAKWNKLYKNTDHHNRRFFPTRQDIQQLALSMKKPLKSLSGITFEAPSRPRKYDTACKDNVTRLLRLELRDNCVFHQSRTSTGPNARPLIIVLQNRNMRETLALHGRHLIFVEKNYEGLRQYGNAVYILVAQDRSGSGGPIAYIVTSDDNVVSFAQGLQKLNSRCQVCPRAFFLGQDIHKFSEVMSALYPESQFLTSWCSVMQEIHQWLQSSEVSGKEHADIRRVLMHFVLELKAHDTEGWFLLAANEIQERIEYDKFTVMLQAGWLSCAAKWSDFGRLGICGTQESGAGLEMFFLSLHHQYLKGIHTKKCLEDLLRLITDNMNDHKNSVEGVVSVPQPLERTIKEQAAELVKQGGSQLITWQGESVALVTCHILPDTTYRVGLITMECECPGVASEGPCLHLCLALALVQGREGHTPQQERHRLASEAYENSDYFMDSTFCVTFHSGTLCVVEVSCRRCTCVASVFEVECVGKILLKIAEGAEEAVTYTVPDPITDTSTLSSPGAALSNAGEGVSCVPWRSDKTAQSITITLSSEERNLDNSEDSLQVIQDPIVIQTCTGIKNESATVTEEISRSDTVEGDVEPDSIMKELDHSSKSSTSSCAMIEDLYQWSRSKEFVDSKNLRDLLKEVHRIALGRPMSSTTRESTIKGKKSRVVGNKNLRAVVRSVKRERRVSEEEEGSGQECVIPPTKVSRSGRTIKVKEEPDFIMQI